MSYFIRCARESGQVLSPELHQGTEHPMNTYLMWVEVTPVAENQQAPWAASSDIDQVSFKPAQPVASDADKVILKSSQGQWQHSQDTDEQRQAQEALRNAQRQAEVQRRLNEWCAGQPEGHQMSFLLLGIEDKNNARYRSYLQALETIRSETQTVSARASENN